MAIQQITIDELNDVFPECGTVIDVREPEEYFAGHIPQAVNVPLSTIKDNIDAFRYTNDVYIVCQSGGRSMRTCEYLHDYDIVNVINVVGGTRGWAAAGGNLTQGELP